MKEGDILLFTKIENNFISKSISIITGSDFSHVGIIYDVKPNKIIIAEALDNGFVLTEHTKESIEWSIENKQIYKMRATKNIYNIKQHIEKYLGRPYGYLDILAILIFRLTGKKLFVDTSYRLICSEAVARVLYDASNKEIDFSKEYGKPYSYITPDDIFLSKFTR